MCREEIRKRRTSPPTRNQTKNRRASHPGASHPTRTQRASHPRRKQRGRKIPRVRKVSKQGQTGNMSKKKRSSAVNWRWLTASLRTSTGKERASQEMPSIANDVCAPPFFRLV